MSQNVLITGTGREMALGFHLVRRCLERGDLVFAGVRKPSEALERLRGEYPESLHILVMDISQTESVRAAYETVIQVADHLDLLINNAVTTAADCNKNVLEADPDLMANVVNVGAVGPLRVIQTFLPLLEKSEMTPLIVNVSSEAGSIGACYRSNMTDYAITKASLNMITKTLFNAFKEAGKDIRIMALHPGWMRTNEGNKEAPLIPREHAETLLKLFEERRGAEDEELFITYEGGVYPW